MTCFLVVANYFASTLLNQVIPEVRILRSYKFIPVVNIGS